MQEKRQGGASLPLMNKKGFQCDIKIIYIIRNPIANIAKSGRPQKSYTAKQPQLTFEYFTNSTKPTNYNIIAPALGAGGREFKSRHPDKQRKCWFSIR